MTRPTVFSPASSPRTSTTRSRIAHQLEVGGVVINGAGAFRPGNVPFGGSKQSGIGRESIVDTVLEMTEEKTDRHQQRPQAADGWGWREAGVGVPSDRRRVVGTRTIPTSRSVHVANALACHDPCGRSRRIDRSSDSHSSRCSSRRHRCRSCRTRVSARPTSR